MKTETALEKTLRLKKEIDERYEQINLLENDSTLEKALVGLKYAASLNCSFGIKTAHEGGLWGELLVSREFSSYKITEMCGAEGYHGSIDFILEGYRVVVQQDDGTIHFSVSNESSHTNTKVDVKVAVSQHIAFVKKLGFSVNTDDLSRESNNHKKQAKKLDELIELFKS